MFLKVDNVGAERMCSGRLFCENMDRTEHWQNCVYSLKLCPLVVLSYPQTACKMHDTTKR